MTLQENMKNGVLYDCSFEAIPEELEKKLYECKELIYDFNASRPREVQYREELVRKVFAEVGENCYIEPPFHANWGCNMHVGKNFYANFNLTVVDGADIYIGDSVMIAPNVVIATGAHPVCPAPLFPGLPHLRTVAHGDLLLPVADDRRDK